MSNPLTLAFMLPSDIAPLSLSQKAFYNIASEHFGFSYPRMLATIQVTDVVRKMHHERELREGLGWLAGLRQYAEKQQIPAGEYLAMRHAIYQSFSELGWSMSDFRHYLKSPDMTSHCAVNAADLGELAPLATGQPAACDLQR